jgi:hypothetical protein
MISDPPSPSPYPQVQPPGPAKHPYRWVIFLLLGVLGLTCLCMAVVAGLVIKNLSSIPGALGANQTLVDQFMRSGVKGDAPAAFALFSSRGQQKMPLSQIQTLFSGVHRDLFAGYQSITVTSYNYHTGSSDDPQADLNLPDGTFIVLRGIIHYDDDTDGSFSAVLEHVDQDTKLYSIDIGSLPRPSHNKQSG